MRASITIRAASEGIATARDLVSDAMSGSTSPEERVEDARLLTSEVVTNAVRHARLGAEGSIGVAVDVSRGRVRVEVSEGGPGFVVTAIGAPSPQTVSGWGLLLVEQVSDNWGVAGNAPNIVWFELNL